MNLSKPFSSSIATVTLLFFSLFIFSSALDMSIISYDTESHVFGVKKSEGAVVAVKDQGGCGCRCGKVIGDVVDMFIPTINMSVYYGSKHVTNGCDIKPSLATAPPTVHISGFSDELYTLVMSDPDAPSPSEPTKREWLHWIVVNIPGAGYVTRGKEVLPYMGPAPPVGIHRYALLLFRQKNPLSIDNPPEVRANFNTRNFAHQFDLGLPVACAYFNAQKEPMNKRR